MNRSAAGVVAAICLALPAAGCGPRTTPASRAAGTHQHPAAAAIALSTHIVVDQFGYRPDDAKVAVIREAHKGFDAADTYRAGPLFDVRSANDGRVVFTGTPTKWNQGAIEASSGDAGWWFDFSALTVPGEYFVMDAKQRIRSAVFRIDPHVYQQVLKTATRMFFYQRSGFAKRAPYADECWTDDAAYLGAHQDGAARDATDPGNAHKARDLSGGWFDAGDTTKYVTFAVPAVHQLLTAYAQVPKAFRDDTGIPESGNGIPDVLDEVKWEIDWLKRMQNPDGSALLKVGNEGYVRASPPSSDHSPRFYVPSCTSATIAAAGMFAHAAYVFAQFPALQADAQELRIRAAAAWVNFQNKPREYHCDSGIVRAGIADWDATQQNAAAGTAAVYLFAVTGDGRYQDYLRAHYRDMRPYRDFGWARYDAEQGDALIFFATLAQSAPDLKAQILADRRADVMAPNGVYRFDGDSDLYRAFMHDGQYHWGSNQIRANYGSVNLDVAHYDLGIADSAPYSYRALEILHYFHGVNPFALVYLSNMYDAGASNSVNEIFHAWYGRYSGRVSAKLDKWKTKLRLNRIATLDEATDLKSKWNDARYSQCGPAPGYLPGGPNKDVGQNGVPWSLSPPTAQPYQKSYKDWNMDWPEASWTVTEPAIYYQAAYVKLLAQFAQ